MRPLFFIMLSLIGFGVSDLTHGQIKPDGKDDVIRVDTQLVDVPIAVNATNGMPVRGLKAANFVVYEDGKRQETVDFSATAAPFEVALLLDTSGSTRNDLQLIQRSAREFIAGLRPGDRVSIVSFNTDRRENQAFAVSEVLCGLTDDRPRHDRKALRTVTELPQLAARFRLVGIQPIGSR